MTHFMIPFIKVKVQGALIFRDPIVRLPYFLI
uniref:Uncharacterized protein n=1 Tax=Anguilla anguilla TaxID=7936 RepID=A0A0E9U822_ANGAN